jgi:diguanylate cyclase (GGDEF)-like protein
LIENMNAFFETQLDFILFCYGLAFILLGTVGSAVARIRGYEKAWVMLGLFGFVHGAGEWLDLIALIVGDTPSFATVRLALMAASFVLLLEFARLSAIQLNRKMPGRWIYVPLAAVVVLGGASIGLSTAGAAARYIFGFFGGIGSSLIFIEYAKRLSGAARRLAILTAVNFALYAVAAGAIVPAAPFWPATVLNQEWFAQAAGVPIQLVRAVLACAMAFSVWITWTQFLVAEISSERYTAHLRRQFVWTTAAMATIVIFGWILTDFLGGIYRQNVERVSLGDIDLLASRFAGETATVNGVVRVLAGTSSTLFLLSGGKLHDDRRARSVLDLNVEASGARLGIILDKSGAIAASSDDDKTPDLQNIRSAPWFKTSIAGGAGYHFAFDPAGNGRYYYASYPVRSEGGAVIGVAVLQKSLDRIEADLGQFSRPYFFANPNGIVVLTNRPEMLLRALWPVSAEKKATLSREFGALNQPPLLDQEITDAQWTRFNGNREYVRRRFADNSQWSLVIAMPTEAIFASRLLGIIITLLVTIMTIIYFVGRERGIREHVQMDRRLELQELARDLKFKATTDPLTGLYNRLKFAEALAPAISRAKRYGTPLALMLYDVDHFKQVNDTYGHQTGDSVLVELSRIVSVNIRDNDTLARWGGEEFMVLVPDVDGEMTRQAAERLRAIIGQAPFDEVGAITCSFGVAQYVEGDTTETLIARADRALYIAKMNGRNRVELASIPGSITDGIASVA